MSGLELSAASGATWFAWEPITPGECMTLVALALAAWGLWQMRASSTARNRQLDAQTETLAAVARGIETMIERTAPGVEKEGEVTP
ncbi:MAG: hypothetical protein OXK81_04540 [Chloroflexota bacterium]|nr:hypothetical protein [Chloroflexota bacterium]